jgi:protein subunit release factor B
MLLHRPTGIQVKCQDTRQQGLNRFIARKLLLDKIAGRRQAAAAARQAEREKLRRQKRRPSLAARARNVETKRQHATKKAFRRRVADE